MVFVFAILSRKVDAFQNQPLPFTTAIEAPAFSDLVPIDISPGHGIVAFTLNSTEERDPISFFNEKGTSAFFTESTLFVTNTQTGETKKVVETPGASWGPSWSPDGKYLAFYSDHDGRSRVWLWNAQSDELVRLSSAIAHPSWGFEQIRWSPESDHILVKLVPENMTLKELDQMYPDQGPSGEKDDKDEISIYVANIEKENTTDADPPKGKVTKSWLNVVFGDLALININTRQVKRVAKATRALSYRFSNDGKKIAYTNRSKTASFDKYDILTADFDGKQQTITTKVSQQYGQNLSWSPNDRYLAFGDENTLRIADTKSKKTVRTFESENLTLVKDFRPPLWIDNENLILISKNAVWKLLLKQGTIVELLKSPDKDVRLIDFVAPAKAQNISHQFFIQTLNSVTQQAGFVSIDLKSKDVKQVYQANVSFAEDPAFHLLETESKGNIIFISENSNTDKEIWMANRDFSNLKQLTNIHQNTNVIFGAAQIIQWKNEKGEDQSGVLILPSDYEKGKKYPLVVKVYGGKKPTRSIYRYGIDYGIDNLQIFATRGYAVLFPDMPVGREAPMADIGNTTILATKRAIEIGVVDPDRVAVFGHSYGGYSALAVGVQSGLFKTIISSAGSSNLLSKYGDMNEDGSASSINWAENGQGRMVDNPWENLQKYIDNSPYFKFNEITASVLLLHGGRDGTVSVNRTKETFVALRRLGKKAKLVIYEQEEHHPETFSKKNGIHYWETIIDWLESEL
ncbi:MAG: prolyl oligopeptidase family serine peptidase [Bacteroidota bacterium]